MKKFCPLIILTLCAGLFLTGCGSSAAADSYNLSQMNSTMAYSTILRINERPADYIGKTITITGQYAQNTIAGTTYHFVCINDATACCTAGIEFVPTGTKLSVNSKIWVSGVFEKYNEGGAIYYHIAAASVKKM
jgi:hypothetical protein